MLNMFREIVTTTTKKIVLVVQKWIVKVAERVFAVNMPYVFVIPVIQVS